MRGFTAITWVLVAAWALALAGCGGESGDDEAARGETTGEKTTGKTAGDAPDAATPADAVQTFLGAVQSGDDQLAAHMLTDVARQKTKERDLEVAPPGSDTAKFTIGELEMIGESGAHVTCEWSDLNADGSRTSESILWVLRQEADGWRIAGMAPTIFPGEPPLLLDFENPDEMIRKLNWVQQEVVRRAQADAMKEARRNDPNPMSEPTMQR